MTTRRSFLRLAAAGIGAALGLVRYAEPMELIPEQGSWIEDRESFYIVRVPDFKTFANEVLDKPTIFLLGQDATMRGVTVNAMANIWVPTMATVADCAFDAHLTEAEKPRGAVLLKGGKGSVVEWQDVHINASGQHSVGLDMTGAGCLNFRGGSITIASSLLIGAAAISIDFPDDGSIRRTEYAGSISGPGATPKQLAATKPYRGLNPNRPARWLF